MDYQTIPTDTRQALAERARRQAVERYALPEDLFDEAERLVMSGAVHLTGHNEGLVGDMGLRAMVTTRECGHCYGIHGICRHRLAVAFADLLARNATGGQADPGNGERPPAASGRGTLGRYGGGKLRPVRIARAARKATWSKGGTDHCPRCGGFLSAGGGCNKCGGV